MTSKPELAKQKLESILNDMSSNHWLFSNAPGHAFMRQGLGKLDFYDTMRLVLAMGKGTTADELNDYFDLDPDRIPSKSALVQRRKQISLSAFEYLFEEFSSSFPQITNRFKGRSVLAADGCHVVYSTNAEIIEDFKKPRLIDHKGYNHMHLNGFVDVFSKAFLDVMVQPGQDPDERQALHQMLDHYKPDRPEDSIITADRGYESYDLLFHCELRHFSYVFRLKDPDSGKCILSSFKDELPNDQEEYDVTVRRFFTDKKNKVMKQQDSVYLYMNPNKNVPHFYELLGDRHLLYLTFRVLRIRTADNTYEYIITNLPHEFDLEDIKCCYHARWGIELAFRYLKHAAGLLHFHSKKTEYLRQEIYATLTMYNFGIFLANEAAMMNRTIERDPDNKYTYEVDFSTALRTARKYFLRDTLTKPVDIIRLLCKYVHAVKEEFRLFPRNLRGIGAIRFNYR